MGAAASMELIEEGGGPNMDSGLVAGRREVFMALSSLYSEKKEKLVKPIKAHADRIPGEMRAVTVEFLRGFVDFLMENGGEPEWDMADICKKRNHGEDEPGTSVLDLTAMTGLSLVESLARIAGVAQTFKLFGRATTYFSYPWVGTKLADVVAAIEDFEALHKDDGIKRFFWHVASPFFQSEPRVVALN